MHCQPHLKQLVYNWLNINQTCLLCDEPAQQSHPICVACEAELPCLEECCRTCALPLPMRGLTCGQCSRRPPAFTRVEAPWHYGFPVDALITRFKHQRQWPLGRLLAQLLGERSKAARAQQLENQLLRKSMQPHFLMNSLSLISELHAQAPAAAEAFIEALGAELRMLNEFAQQPSIALAQELALCHNYLDIMATRLQQPCSLQVDGAAADIRVPPALLLTALENAFSHNRYRHGARFVLHSARLAQTQVLTLSLPQGAARPHAGSGLGEQYIRASLHAVFGDAARYASERHAAGWRLTFTLPAAP